MDGADSGARSRIRAHMPASTAGGPASQGVDVVDASGPGDSTGPWWPKRGAVIAVGISALFIVAGLGGAWWYFGSSEGPQDYIEVYLSDLPADLERLDIYVAGVFVGKENHSLQVDLPVLNLLAFQGPERAVRVASGFVPAGVHEETHILIPRATATVNGTTFDVPVPQSLLRIAHSGRADTNSNAFLFDIDVESSLVLTDQGFQFKPHVSTVWSTSYDEQPPKASDGKADTAAFHRTNDADFKAAPSSPPREQGTSTPPPQMSARAPSPSSPSPSPSAAGRPPAPENKTAPGSESLLPETGNQNTDTNITNLTGGEVGLFVGFSEELAADGAAILEALGLTPIYQFKTIPVIYVRAFESQIGVIYATPGVVTVEREQPVMMNLDTSKTAIRSTIVTDPLTGLRDAQGRIIDGRGIGVAVIDTGIDATHADLPYNDGLRSDYAVGKNLKLASGSHLVNLIPLANTDLTGGHGTHVAGIIAGRGNINPQMKGVAPGAVLYGLGVGEASTTLWTNQGLEWVLLNHDKVSPPIRVVSNSWSTGTTHNPSAVSTQLVNQLVAAGVVVVFSADNQGGDGTSIRTSAEGQNPTEGVIMVAAYTDANVGSRDGSLLSSSSRGKTSVPSSWPDLSAPGGHISAAKAATGVTTGVGVVLPYKELSGTSQAAPHVSGTVALMLQANPSLSPAQVESILESSANHFTWGGSYAVSGDPRYNGSHYAKGHGLLDAKAAVQTALSA
jgi:serine protease AprX